MFEVSNVNAAAAGAREATRRVGIEPWHIIEDFTPDAPRHGSCPAAHGLPMIPSTLCHFASTP